MVSTKKTGDLFIQSVNCKSNLIDLRDMVCNLSFT